MVHANLIDNCPVTPENISHAHQLFGENLAGLREKTVWKKPEQVVTDYVQIPRDLVQMNKYVTLTADVMFVNNLAFVITYGWGIGLITAEFTPNRKANQLASNLKRIIQLYSRAGFIVQTILMDMEFNKVIPELPEVNINTSAASEHVAEVERCIRIIKERCRACISTMPFKNSKYHENKFGTFLHFLAECNSSKKQEYHQYIAQEKSFVGKRLMQKNSAN